MFGIHLFVSASVLSRENNTVRSDSRYLLFESVDLPSSAKLYSSGALASKASNDRR